MARYKMEDNKIVDTDKAQTSWDERTEWNGSNHVSVHTGDQWCHETLYKSSKGRYYIVSWSQCQPGKQNAYWISNEGAVAWLVLNEDTIPEDLASIEEEIVE